MILLDETPEGIILSVKAHPGARRNGINGTHAGALKVTITQAPEKGKANEAIIQLLADLLKLKRNQLQLTSGHTSPHKKLRVTGISHDELLHRLQQFVNE